VDEKAVAAAGGSGGKGKLMIFSGAGVAAVIGAAFIFATFAVPAVDESQGEPGTDGKAEVEQQVGFFDVPVIMVNLKGTNKKRVLKIHLNALFEAENIEQATSLFTEKLPKIKDSLTTLLTEKTLEDVEDKENLNTLKVELMDAINKAVFTDCNGKVEELYYAEFLVQ
jgi:flagellar basal body-associated protein FliL